MSRWLLPEGIEELTSVQAKVVETLRRQLLDVFDNWGYELILPPLVEYTDSLLTGLGAGLDEKTIKVTDQVTGRSMGLRADISPQAARIDARHAAQNQTNQVNRLCYSGTVIHAKPEMALSSRAPIQIGAELFGVEGADADLEIILLMISALTLATEEKLTLELGHVGISRWLREECEARSWCYEEIQSLIQSKRLPELDQRLADCRVEDEPFAKQLRALPRLLGDVKVLDSARELFSDVSGVLEGLDVLSRLADQLNSLTPDVTLFFDLGEMRGSNYHTGVVFSAFAEVRGAVRRIANGGRYDNVGKAFGQSRAATGFSADLKTLARISHSVPAEKFSVYAPISNEPGFWDAVAELREDAVRVILGQDSDNVSVAAEECQQQLHYLDGRWQLQPLSSDF